MPPPRSRRAFCVATPKLSEDRGKPLLHGSRQGAYAAAVSFDEPDSALMLLSIPDGRVLSALRQPRFDDVVVEERGKAAWQTATMKVGVAMTATHRRARVAARRSSPRTVRPTCAAARSVAASSPTSKRAAASSRCSIALARDRIPGGPRQAAQEARARRGRVPGVPHRHAAHAHRVGDVRGERGSSRGAAARFTTTLTGTRA